MAVFRVQKTRDYTVMANHHLRDTTLSLKAKGLLSLMLSLPDDWDYTTRGLSVICKDGVDGINSGIHELEQRGYVTRCRVRNERGQLTDTEYTIWEAPQPDSGMVLDEPKQENPSMKKPDREKPKRENPRQASPEQVNPAQLNTKISSTEIPNTHLSNPSYPSIPTAVSRMKDDWTDVAGLRERVKDNIEYDILKDEYSPEQLDEVVDLIVETLCSNNPIIPIGKDAYPAALVRDRLLSINSLHIQYVFDCLSRSASDVRNIKKYLLTALFNAPATMKSYYRALVQHDLYGD